MACRCAERKTAILKAATGKTSVLTAARFVAKTGAQDVATVTREGTQRITKYLQRRGIAR